MAVSFVVVGVNVHVSLLKFAVIVASLQIVYCKWNMFFLPAQVDATEKRISETLHVTAISLLKIIEL